MLTAAVKSSCNCISSQSLAGVGLNIRVFPETSPQNRLGNVTAALAPLAGLLPVFHTAGRADRGGNNHSQTIQSSTPPVPNRVQLSVSLLPQSDVKWSSTWKSSHWISLRSLLGFFKNYNAAKQQRRTFSLISFFSRQVQNHIIFNWFCNQNHCVYSNPSRFPSLLFVSCWFI